MAQNILAASNNLMFEPGMPVDMAAVQAKTSNQAINPRLGPLWAVQFKISTYKYMVRLSSAPTQGAASIKLMAGATVISETSLTLNGETVIAGAVPVDLSQVAGETELKTVVDVTGAADAGITAKVDSWLTVEVPVTVSGC